MTLEETAIARKDFTPDQEAAVSLLEKQPASPERDLLMFMIASICDVGCGDDEGCFYCERKHRALKEYLGLK